jgi:tellurite resistance protein TehA-like permease
MKAHLITASTVFGVLGAAHVWRIAAENRYLAEGPLFLFITAAAALLCIWGVYLLRRRGSTGSR